jgi:peroxiredoxin (alkyl hydroperoxide reductase subunit C)
MTKVGAKAPDFTAPACLKGRAGVETRGRFILDHEGVIHVCEVLAPPFGGNVSETIRQIQAFQYMRSSKGTEATPSGWRPGKLTLVPDLDPVGRVWDVWKTPVESE